jgi:heme A synthase
MSRALGDWLGGGEGMVLLAVLGFATLVTTALFLLALAATRRRRTTPYLLLTAAIGLLVVRSLVGIGTAMGQVPMPVHHVVEHTSDAAIALVVLGAVYWSRDPRP